MRFLGMLAGATALLATASASATTIDFSTEPPGTEEFSTAGPEQTLILDAGGGQTVTFSGGVILTNEGGGVNVADTGNIYATISTSLEPSAGAGLTNPLTITFSAPVANFQLEIVNSLGTDFAADAGYYELTSSAGGTDFFSLTPSYTSVDTVGFSTAATTFELYYLTGSGGTVNTDEWDFAIGDVSFSPASTTTNVPEPATWSMLILGLAMVGFGVRRRNSGAKQAA